MTQIQPQKSSFEEEIAAIVSPREAGPSPRLEFLGIWRQFAEGLRFAQVEAEVRLSDNGKTFSLVLWPLHRPSWRQFMLTFSIDEAGVHVLGRGDVLLESPAELKQWLRDFARNSHFKNSLQVLREMASEPVSAALVMPDGREIVVEVSAEQQRALASLSSPETSVTVALARGEAKPVGEFPLYFRSAGLEFSVKKVTDRGRQIEVLLAPNV